ncbi:TonB-dependent receptor plug domain-containing protein [Rurimicrobium arvi]|uniref:TonB-dependent receptor n=1 Tax=Rurimicrobium arvi TaxID=2049916 RepID=A0ABP8MEN2_9BACT
MKKLLLPICALSPFLVKAQAGVDLNPVSVTTSRVAQKVNETGRNISVIDGAMFRQLPVQSLDELLKYVPGVEVQARGPMGAQSDIVLRGGTYQQVLILLDGVKINDPITGHFNSYIPVAPSEILRIEVLRGPAAAVYGAEAVGGVIHVITKTFAAQDTASGLHGVVKASGGEYNFWNTDAGVQYAKGRVKAALGVLSNNTTGQLLRGDNRGYIHNNTVSGSVSADMANNWKMALRGSYDNRDFAAQNFYTTFASDTATEKVSTAWAQAQLKQHKNRHSHEIDAVFKNASDNYLYNSVSTANENKSKYAMAQYLYTLSLSHGFDIAGGAQSSLRVIRSNDRGNHQTGQIAGFGTLLYHYEHLNLSGSLRADYDGNYGFALIPQLNASYNAGIITFRGTAGRATRSADFTERYNNYNKTLVKSGSIGNPDLTAEQSWSYEAGATLNVAQYLKLSGTAFYRSQDNVIDWVTTPYADMPRQTNLDPSGTYALAKNLKQVKTKGMEFEATFQKQLSKNQSIYVNAGITLMRSTSNDPVPSFYIIAHAKTLIQSTVMYQFGRLSLSGNMIYKERNPQMAKGINAEITSSYAVFNARVGLRILSQLSVYASCNNIGNIRYSDLLGSTMPTRWFMGGASYNF